VGAYWGFYNYKPFKKSIMKKSNLKYKVAFIAVLILSNFNIYAQNIKTSEELKFGLTQINKKHTDIINADITKVYGSLNYLLTKISEDSADKTFIINMLNGVAGQVNEIKTKVDNYKNDINDTSNVQINIIRNQVTDLLLDIVRCHAVISDLQNSNYENIAKIILGYIKNVEDLSIKIKDLENDNLKLQNKLKAEIEWRKNLEDTINTLNSELQITKVRLEYLTAGNFKVALSAGLNYEFIGDAKYIIKKDSCAREISSKGLQGMVSAVVLYHPDSIFHIKNNFDFLLNVPIAEIGFGDNTNITSIFNRPLALGLGLGYSLTSNFSICCIFNVSRAQVIDDETLKEKKFSEDYLSIVDLSKYSTSVRTKMSFTVGFLYKFGKGQK